MEKKNLKTVIFVLTFIISCFIIVSCKDFNACSCTTDNENRELPKDTCTIDTLESGVLCKSVGGYTVIDYSYVSPSTNKKYAYDYKGRKVFEEGCTYSGAYAFVVWDYNQNDTLKALYWSDTIEGKTSNGYEGDDGLSMLVSHLVDVAITDSDVASYVFDYHPAGHIVRVYDPKHGQEIRCPSGGEITFKVYEMDGSSTSELMGNDALNIEFRVKGIKNGNVWNEILYLGYRQIAHMTYNDSCLISLKTTNSSIK